MKHLPPLVVASIVLLPFVTACHDRTSIPTAPSPTVPSAPATPAQVPSPGARAVAIGDVIDATVVASDAPCDNDPLSDAPDPCLHYVVNVPSYGNLTVDVTWDNPRTWMALWFIVPGAQARESDNSNASFHDRRPMFPGPNEFAIALHAPAPGTDRQSFRLTTSFQAVPQ